MVEVVLRHTMQHEVDSERSFLNEFVQCFRLQCPDALNEFAVRSVEFVERCLPAGLSRFSGRRPVFLRIVFDEFSQKTALDGIMPERKVIGDLPRAVSTGHGMGCGLSGRETPEQITHGHGDPRAVKVRLVDLTRDPINLVHAVTTVPSQPPDDFAATTSASPSGGAHPSRDPSFDQMALRPAGAQSGTGGP